MSGSCENVNVTNSVTVLESPNYPRPPPDNVRCEWWVTVPDTMSPLVRVPDFRTNASKCDDAIVNVRIHKFICESASGTSSF